MLKKSENNGTEEIGLVTPTPVPYRVQAFHALVYHKLVWVYYKEWSHPSPRQPKAHTTH